MTLTHRIWAVAAVLAAATTTAVAAQPADAPVHAPGGEANLVLPDLTNPAITFLGMTGHSLLMIGLLVCAVGLLFGVMTYVQLQRMPVHRSMREVSELIYETCKAYLAQQGRFLMLLWLFIGAIVAVYFGILAPHVDPATGAVEHGMPAVKVFMSYRRADNPFLAGRLKDELGRVFGEDNVFYDVDSIRAGADFRSVIRDTLETVDAVIALVGSDWDATRLAASAGSVKRERLPVGPWPPGQVARGEAYHRPVSAQSRSLACRARCGDRAVRIQPAAAAARSNRIVSSKAESSIALNACSVSPSR